jgi:dodecin
MFVLAFTAKKHIIHNASCLAALATSAFAEIERRESQMAESVYRVTEVIGVSTESWEAAARNAVQTAAKTVRDLRVAEVLRQDVTIENGSLVNYRVRLAISFKYDSGE